MDICKNVEQASQVKNILVECKRLKKWVIMCHLWLAHAFPDKINWKATEIQEPAKKM